METDNGVGVVELRKRKLQLPEGGLKLAYGGVLKEIEIAYEECGAPLNEAGTNAIYICHALTGDSHVAGIKVGEEKPSGWWEGMVGPGRAIDTKRYHVICANVLGGCSGTTGPMSTNPDTGRPYGSAFPQYTFDDAIDVFRMLLKELGVTKLAALIGGSYGGTQVVNWMTRYPDDMEKVILVATSAHLNTQAVAFSVMSRNSITDDPNWKGGDYYAGVEGKCGEGPRAGLASARQLAHITYLSRELLQQKFDRRLQQNFVEAPEADKKERDRLFKTYFQIESYLDYQASKFLRRFDANSYLHITRSMDLSDPCDKYGTLDDAFARVKAKTLVVSYENDILFPYWQSEEIVLSLMKAHKSVSYCHLESGTGHDSFLTDIADLSKIVGGFLGNREVKVLKWQQRLYRNIVKMIDRGAHVIDIGCGDGTLLNVLKAEKAVKGDGVEIDVERYEEAIADGHDMFWDDIDDKLQTIPDRHYDVAIMSDTLQEVKNPRGALHELLRIADEAIVTFPNFAAYRIRFTLGFTGRLPVSKQLPYQWYDSPNIHCVTLKDFTALCEKEGIEVKEVRAESRHLLGKLLMFMGFKNLGASKIVARIARKSALIAVLLGFVSWSSTAVADDGGEDAPAASEPAAQTVTRQPLSRYQQIIDRKMFGPLPDGFDSSKMPSEVQKTGKKAGEQLTKEQEEIKRSVKFSAIDVASDGTVRVGFTDSSDAKKVVSCFLAVGESSNGWTVKAADAEAATMTIEKDGIELELSLGNDAAGGKNGGGANGALKGAAKSKDGLLGGANSLRTRRALRNQKEKELQAENERREKEREEREAQREAQRAARDAERDAERQEQTKQLLQIQEELKKVREEKEAAEAKAAQDSQGEASE